MIERQIIDGQPATVVYFKPGMVPGTKLDHSLVKLVFDNGIVQFLAPKKDVRTADDFDPNEARDPTGKWTSGGGSSGKTEEPTVSFVSPNTEVNSLSFSQAEEGLKSPRQKLLAGISHKIDSDFGIKDIRVNHVIGAWADGAENSVMTNSASTDIQLERAAAAAKAYLANQKAVLLFHPDPNGTDFLAQFRVKGKLSDIHEQLLKDGVAFHTLEPRGPDVVVHIYGSDKETLSLASIAAKNYNTNLDVHPGSGEFIGTTKEDGTDEEQRADARAIYQKTIEGVGSAGKLPDQWRTQWQNYIDNWERETGEKIGGVKYLKSEEVKDAFDPNESRDPSGKWTSGGGTSPKHSSKHPTQHPTQHPEYYRPPHEVPELHEPQPTKAPDSFETPKKTKKAYKLFETKKDQPGRLFPLFIGAKTSVPIGEWVPAKSIPTKSFAPRPGWHAGELPLAPHLRTKQGKVASSRVWAEVEVPDDVDWQKEADKFSRKTKAGKTIPGEIKDRVPVGGYYKFNTKPGQGGTWVIGGAMRVTKVLSDDEVHKLLTDHGKGDDAKAETHEPGGYPFKTKDKRWRLFHFHTRDGVYTLRLRDKYDPNEPRDPSGEWTTGGGSPRKTEEPPPSSSAPKEASKPSSVKVRHDNGDIEQVKLPDDVVTKARQLQDDPEKYFKISNDADMIPVDKLVQTRARPEGVAHAVDLMAAAYKGEGGKRGPIHVQKLEDGHYLVLDGNSTTTIATAAGWEHLPAIVIPDASYLPKKPLKNSDGHPGLISTALPKGKASEFNQPSLALAKSDPKSFGLHIQVYKDNPTAYPLTKEQLTGSDEEVARHVIDHIKSNLRYIYEHTPEAQRNRTAKWYDGARKMVDEHVKTYKEYGMRDTTVAGVYASLSPNNLWDQNVEQGDRMIDIYCKHRQEPWDKKMDDAVAKISNKTIKKAALSIAGKSYDELDSPSKKGLWIRIYDQSRWPESPTYKSYTKNKPAIQPFHKVTPEGERQEWYLTKKGVPQSLSWQSMAMMAKAVRILESKGDRDVISKALKGSTPTHKVRSFYNNILDPNSPNKDVTMDTHAIDAAWLMDDPIAVLHNFGNTPQKKGRPAAWVKGTPGSVKTGIGGNYSFNAEAYRELADDLKIQPRQLQSIIWETKREWMVDMTEDNNKRVQDTWEQYRQGNLTQSQAQDKVKQIVDEDLALTPAKRKEIARAKSKAKREAKKAAA